MVREMLNKIDNKFDYIKETDTKKAYAKAIANGYLEGTIDGLVYVGLGYVACLALLAITGKQINIVNKK